MRVKPGQSRQFFWVVATTELFGIVAIAYCFLTALPFSAKILVTLAITLFLTGLERLQLHVELTKDRALEQIWMNHLTLRFAIDEMLFRAKLGQRLHPIDWQAMSKQAIEDIKSFDMQVKFEEEISSTKTIDVGVHLFFVIPTMLVVRGLLGFGLALSAQTAAPQFVRWIT